MSNKPIIFILVAMTVVIGGWMVVRDTTDDKAMTPIQTVDQSQEEDAASPVTESQKTEPSPSSTTNEVGGYITLADFQVDPSKYSEARKVYFFHAKWCSTCRALEADIQANVNQLPSDVVIIKTDYDTEDDLRKQFDIRVQHTLVYFDNDGTELGKWTGHPSLSSFLTSLQQVSS